MLLAVRDLPTTERPLDRLRRYGAAHLATPELLSILLGAATDRAPAAGIGAALSEACAGSLRRLATDLPMMQSRVRGLGPARVAQLSAMFELAHRLVEETRIPRPPMRSPADIAGAYQQRLRDLTVEEFHIAALDAQHCLERDVRISSGLLSSCCVHAREVFRPAIAVCASAVVLVHNHPSGDPTPSPEDRTITANLVASGRLLDIPVYDHVIIGDRRHCSFLESGWL